ncbi:hypothetical protein TMatcc_001762 [Talaromyces marneffei ATCC 18224]|uniref:NACHT domain-containing protein n=1 Tax=Talaromyces marneffei (strain ATCC 18224 / CBS 334.59 / QM 7333) TaxID=441960 RepID=B6QHQ5_TALMQ|nr:conserved hypothetical protein [Talaromyces marneffei ATCC 18224]
MASPTREKTSFQHRLRQRISRLRDRSRGYLNDDRKDLLRDSQDETSLANASTSASQQHTTSTSSILCLTQANDPGIGSSTNITNDKAQVPSNDSGQGRATESLPSNDNTGRVSAPSDLWSVAYREAVESFGKELDVAILEAGSVMELFTNLEEIEKGITQKDTFVRRLGYLQSVQGPIETFKLALDLASPAANINLTASTVVGIVKNVTEIIISLAEVKTEFAAKIKDMHERISYIDDCDTLGQKTNGQNIHTALVSVYKKLLEFYQVAFKTLTKKGVKLITSMVRANSSLPTIAVDFVRSSEALQGHVSNATAKILDEMRTVLYDAKIILWLDNNKLLAQDIYYENLKDLRADGACEFLLENTNFQNWYHTPGSRQLAICGPMGCGKTVLMTFLVDELTRQSTYQLPTPKILSYYCRDNETGETIYILSTLILSLLQHLPGLKKPFYEWYGEALVSGTNPAASTSKMGALMQKLLKSVDRPIFILIDGLDECDSKSQRSLLDFLKRSARDTPGLKSILSFRREKKILDRLDGTPRIDLSRDIDRDRIIVEKTVETQLDGLSADVKAEVIKKLSNSAQGSAIWTRMVVELIKEKDLSALGLMKHFLENEPLPQDLSNTYLALVSRHTDLESKQYLWIALKLLAAALRPLSILELAWAVALNAAPYVSSVEALAEYVDDKRVMSFIGSFIMPSDFKDPKKRQVQLAHQSVKEFIKQHAPSEGKNLKDNQQDAENLETFMLETCVRYLLLEEIGTKTLFSEEQAAIEVLPQGDDLFGDIHDTAEYDKHCTWETWEENMIPYDPSDRGFGEFFVYASCYWPEHFGRTASDSSPSLENIETLCKVGSIRLSNWIEQKRRPDCAIEPRFEFDSDLYDPLSITSLYGSEAMLRHMLMTSNLSTNNFFGDSVMRAVDQVLQWGDVSRLGILFLDDRVGRQLQNLDFFRLVVRYWSKPKTPHENWDTVFDLVDPGSNDGVQQQPPQWVDELLDIAVDADCEPLINRLTKFAAVVEHRRDPSRE